VSHDELCDARAAATISVWLEKFEDMTPDQIAAVLAHEGIRGIPGDAEDCGFVRFFRAKTGRDVHVDGVQVRLPTLGFLALRMPLSTGRFVQLFDAMHYPNLVEANPRGHKPHVDGLDQTVFALAAQ
jgi:hypothetical protein